MTPTNGKNEFKKTCCQKLSCRVVVFRPKHLSYCSKPCALKAKLISECALLR